jgi:ferric-dicitrate binding protein FerR (iron transport regulator)
MHSVNRSRVTGAHRPNLWSTENHPRPALGVRIWTRLLAALHESRKQEAARVIRRHRDLIQNFQAIELPGRGMEPKPVHRRRIELRAGIEHILIAALIIGFALALGFALNELDAALKDSCSSLATIATIGN